jgi:patatin-like phospholipase/acyl hydrolase
LLVLEEIEKQTGRFTAEIFDLIGGTSTGSFADELNIRKPLVD